MTRVARRAIPLMAVTPKFHRRTITVASSGWSSDSAIVVTAERRPPIIATGTGAKRAAWRSIASISSDSGVPVRVSVAKQRAVSPADIPSGPILIQLVRHP